MSAKPRYLIVRIAGIGDVVMVSALLERIRTEQPAAEVVWVCGTTAAPLVSRFAGVSRVVAVDEQRLLRGSLLARVRALLTAWRAIGRGPFDRAFVAHADRRYRALVLPLVGTPVSMLDRQSTANPNPVPGRYFGDEYARLFSGAGHSGPVIGHYSLARIENLPTVAQRPSSGRRRIAIVPAGAKNVLRESALRRWPVRSYVALAKRLVDSGHEVVLIGNTDDAWVRADFADLPVDDQIGRLSLDETVSALAACDAVVSHDTGPMHLARLVGTPLVALFGPTMPAQFVVEDERTVALWGGAHLACRPCYDGREFARCSDNVCVSSIGVDNVFEALSRLLLAEGHLPARTPGPTEATATPSRTP